MKALRLALAALLALSMLLGGCSPYTAYSQDLFGYFDTVITVKAYAASPEQFQSLVEQTRAGFERLHRLFDIYNLYEGLNNIKTINDNAGGSPVAVDMPILDLLTLSIQWHEQTGGKFNIALGSVLDIWHTYQKAADPKSDANALPTPQELQAAAAHTDIHAIVIDRDAGTVLITDERTRINVGSVAKGYATELVAQDLISAGYTSFVISAGGNVRAVGHPLDGARNTWTIGIQNPAAALVPDENEGLAAKVRITDTSLVTSGGYERNFMAAGRRYHHLIDPDTLYPPDYYSSVTILAVDSGLCDILSTAVFLMPYEQALAFLDELAGVEALFIMPDGQIRATPGMQAVLVP